MADVNSPFAGMSDQDLQAYLNYYRQSQDAAPPMNLGGPPGGLRGYGVGQPPTPGARAAMSPHPQEALLQEEQRRKAYQAAGLDGGGYQAALRGDLGGGAPVQGQFAGTGQEGPPPSAPPAPPPALSGAFGPPTPTPDSPRERLPPVPGGSPGALTSAMAPTAPTGPGAPSRAPMMPVGPGQFDPGALPAPPLPGAPPQAPAPQSDTWGVMDKFEGRARNRSAGVSGDGAVGFGQVIGSTYTDWTRKYRGNNPWMPATHADYAAAPEAVQRRVYDEVVKPNEYDPALKAAGLPSTPITLAVTNFLGISGGPKFMLAAAQNPQGIAAQMVSPGAASNNRGVFYEPDGRPRTAMEVMQRIQGGPGGGGGSGEPSGSAPIYAPPELQEPQKTPSALMDMLKAPNPREDNERGPMKNGQFLMALGAGMLGGKGFGDGISKGMTAAQALSSGYSASQDKRDENSANRALARARFAETQRSNRQDESTALGRLGISERRQTVQENIAQGYIPFGQPFQNEQGQMVFAMRSKTGGDVRYGVVGGQAPAGAAQTTPQSPVTAPGGSPSPTATQAPTTAPQAATGPGPLTPVAQNTQSHRHALADNLKTDREIAETASGGRQQIADLANFRAAVTQAGGQMGPTAIAHVRRFMTSTFGDGFGENVADLDLLKKAATTANSADALARAKGNFARFTQGEFQTLGKGFAMLETDPRAAMVIIDESLKKAQARLAAADRYFSPEFEEERAGMQGKAGANRAWWQRQMASDPTTSGNAGVSAWAPGPNGNLIYRGTTQSGGALTIERIN